jgi:hypothetical protein
MMAFLALSFYIIRPSPKIGETYMIETKREQAGPAAGEGPLLQTQSEG